MQPSAKGLAAIIASEAIVPFRYRDSVGVDTWGVGHTAAAGSPDPGKMPFGKEATLAEVVTVFRRDMGKFGADVSRAVKVPLAQHEFDALLSFHFNTGGISRAAITAKLNAGDRAGAAAAFDNWHKPPEIIPRRDREKALFKTGAYPPSIASVIPADERGRVLWGQARRIDVMPTVAAMMDANAAEAEAKNDAGKAAGATVGAGGTGTVAGTVPSDPSPAGGVPDAIAGGATIRTILLILAVALIVAAAGWGVRAFLRWRRAKQHDKLAALALASAPTVQEQTTNADQGGAHPGNPVTD